MSNIYSILKNNYTHLWPISAPNVDILPFLANDNAYFCMLNSHHYADVHSKVEVLCAWGESEVFNPDISEPILPQLSAWLEAHKALAMGYMGYDLKNEIERLQSYNEVLNKFPLANFFIPKYVVFETDGQWYAATNESIVALEACLENINTIKNEYKASNQIKALTTKAEYIKNVDAIRQNIIEGDCYELNYCIGFEVDNPPNPLTLYQNLSKEMPMPFGALYRAKNEWIVSASPERFLQKTNDTLIAQPMKGTAKREDNPEADALIISALKASEKERAENVMIVDLMRNDFTKCSLTGSIEVPLLFEVISYPSVHQMISTVKSTLKPDTSIEAIINATFPMGSMTGAPKIKSMELIEHYENFKRGAFSGAFGYVLPNMDFDFNVLIRSLFIDTNSSKLHFMVGSAITFDALPEAEYEECMLKAEKLMALFQ